MAPVWSSKVQVVREWVAVIQEGQPGVKNMCLPVVSDSLHAIYLSSYDPLLQSF